MSETSDIPGLVRFMNHMTPSTLTRIIEDASMAIELCLEEESLIYEAASPYPPRQADIDVVERDYHFLRGIIALAEAARTEAVKKRSV